MSTFLLIAISGLGLGSLYFLLAAGLSWQGALSEGDWLVYLKADNLLDVEARQHSSLIKDEVVLPGRNLTLGTRFTF